MFDLGEYPGGVGLGVGDDWIAGHVVEIDEAELPALDEFEEVPGGLFARRSVVTEAGRSVWAYEYLGVVPAGARSLQDWSRRAL
jgi:gamma-glutamylcyclotransferase (GGCT)/AIG2-like uncharacterized protein YtfP